MIEVIGFDADDTLWQNEDFFRLTHKRFAALLADYMPKDHVLDRLIEAERRNLGRYGYGIKGFMLSMIETAIEVSNQTAPASVIAEIIAAGQEMLEHPINLLPGVGNLIPQLANDYHLVLITKGDLLDQERKLAQSGLGDHFDDVHIVSEKTPDTYAGIFGTTAPRAIMVGNSMKSDILPALEVGAFAAHVPHYFTWALEQAEPPQNHPRFHALTGMKDLPETLSKIRRN